MNASNVIRLSLPQNNPLCPRGLQGQLVTTANALAVMQTFTSLVLRQADMDIKSFQDDDDGNIAPAYRHHQQAARDLAQHFQDELDPRVIGLLTSVSGTSAMFTAFLAEVEKLLPRLLDADDSSVRNDLEALFEEMARVADREEKRVTDLRTDLEVFNQQLKVTNDKLKEDQAEIERQVGAEGGKLDELQQEIDDAQGAIRMAIGTIAVSAISITGGAAVVVIGAVGTFASAGTSTSVILAGVGFIATGVTGTVAAAITLDNNNKKLLKLFQDYSEVSMTLAVLKVWQGQALSLAEAASEQVAAVHAVEATWNGISNGIAEMVALMRGAGAVDNVTQLESIIRTARGDWTGMLAQIDKIEERLTSFDVQRSDALPQPMAG